MDFELKKVENGYIVHVNETGSEYIFDTERKLLKFIKELIALKPDA